MRGRKARPSEVEMMLEAGPGLAVWEDEGGTISHRASPVAALPGARARPSLPFFVNDIGVPEIRIGTRVFNCIGASPPADHPHVYLTMEAHGEILCPYCSTRFRHDRHLAPDESAPPGCRYTPNSMDG